MAQYLVRLTLDVRIIIYIAQSQCNKIPPKQNIAQETYKDPIQDQTTSRRKLDCEKGQHCQEESEFFENTLHLFSSTGLCKTLVIKHKY